MIAMDVRELPQMDRALLSACPVMLVPPHAEPKWLMAPGKRYLIGSNGVFFEVRSEVLHMCIRVSDHDLPVAGRIDGEFLMLQNGQVPVALMKSFAEAAQAASPAEAAAAILWCPKQGEYVLRYPQVEKASAAMIRYRDDLDDALLVFDLHSHGTGSAFFSATDNESDLSRPGPYIAVVAGECGKDQTLRMKFRLVCAPYLRELTDASIATARMFV